MPLGNEAVPVHTRRDPVRPFDPQNFPLNDVGHFSVNSVLTIALYDALFMFFRNLDSLRSGKTRCAQQCSSSASSEYRSQCSTARNAAGGEHRYFREPLNNKRQEWEQIHWAGVSSRLVALRY